MVDSKLPANSVAAEIRRILDSPAISALIAEIDDTRLTGRPGYRIRSQIGMTLVKHRYCLPFWSRTIRLVNEHNALQAAIGCTGTGEPDGVPSEDAMRRFRAKLIEHRELRGKMFDRLLASLKEQHPEMGEHVAIDGSALHAYANGHKTVSKGGAERKPEDFSDPDASWGHQSATSTEGKGRSIYGYKLHAAVDAKTDLPIAWHLSTGKGYEPRFVPGLLDEAKRRGFATKTAAMDRGYDYEMIYEELEERDCHPVVPLRQTTGVKNGRHLPHECEHGTWVFAGSDYGRRAAKFRCPTGECEVSHRWVPASRFHTLIPRTTNRWLKLKRGRASVEREFGRLKHDYGLAPIRTRKMERVKLHADLAVMTRLCTALIRSRT